MYLNNIYTSVTGLMRIGLSLTGLLHLTLYVSMFCPASGIIPFRIFRAAEESLISEFTQVRGKIMHKSQMVRTHKVISSIDPVTNRLFYKKNILWHIMIFEKIPNQQ